MVVNDEKCYFGSNKIYVMLLLRTGIGVTSAVVHTNVAIANGATGHIISFIVTYIFLGIPLLYMELIIGQFTARDCIAIWKCRRCIQHIGYAVVFWQFSTLLYNHRTTTFATHYLMVSFERPIPYYKCGYWSTKNCNILEFNYTINQQCIKTDSARRYCENLYTTYPECQYWKNYILRSNQANQFSITWRLTLSSGLICIALFLSCFRRIESIRWVISALTIYPIVAYTVILLGSMTQKGLVARYDEILDSNFKIFSEKFSVSSIVTHVVFSLGVGSGILLNFSSKASFRSACYANTVITVVIETAFSILAITTTTLMACPYAYEFGMATPMVMSPQMRMIFEKAPRMLSQYDYKYFYLILFFSCQSVLGIGTDVTTFFSLLEMLMSRYSSLARYPALVTLAGSTVIFFVTLPFLTYFGMSVLVKTYRQFMSLISVFIAILECLVFVFWYGFARFSEDVYFMQGIPPIGYMKFGWIFSVFLLIYTLINEIRNRVISFNDLGSIIGVSVLVLIFGFTLIPTVVQILVAICRNKLQEVIQLDPSWGPKNVNLQRSRAMFSAQAITKEYLYRQYHLKAGIVARQMSSNTRRESNN